MFIKHLVRSALMLLGVCFLILIIYSKVVGRTHGWNRNQGLDIKQEFTKAYLLLPDNTMKVFEVKCWNDYEFSDQLQFTTKDGTTYLTHASRIILTDEKD